RVIGRLASMLYWNRLSANYLSAANADSALSVLAGAFSAGMVVDPLSEFHLSEPHDVVSAIHVVGLARDAGARIGGEEHAGAAHLADFHIALQRRALGVRTQHVSQAGDAARGQRLDRTRRDRIDPDLPPAQILRQIPDRAFERGLGHAHDVIVRHNFFRAVV